VYPPADELRVTTGIEEEQAVLGDALHIQGMVFIPDIFSKINMIPFASMSKNAGGLQRRITTF